MLQENFIVGSREFTCVKMNAFVANKLALRIQKIIIPIIAALSSNNSSIGDIDVKEAASLLCEHLSEQTIDEIALPMLAESKTYCVDEKRFIKTAIDIDQCFTVDNLLDFYELIFLVGKYQFSSFFQQAVNRFGVLTENAPKN